MEGGITIIHNNKKVHKIIYREMSLIEIYTRYCSSSNINNQ